jgi:hypothetical protein
MSHHVLTRSVREAHLTHRLCKAARLPVLVKVVPLNGALTQAGVSAARAFDILLHLGQNINNHITSSTLLTTFQSSSPLAIDLSIPDCPT